MKEKTKISVYYDGACGLCRREIEHYMKVADPEKFEWVDLTQNAEAFKAQGYKISEGLKALHVRDLQGQMHIGADGFVAIWRAMKRWRVLAWFVALPGVLHFSRFAYKHFANWRFNRLEHCQIALKQEQGAKE